jgi:hypothetical protein
MNAPIKTPVILSALVDRLALIKAQIADLSAEEKALKAELIAADLPSIEGTAHRVAVSFCPGRESIDWEAVAAKFNPSRQLITAHTSQGSPFHVVRVSARKGA